MHFLTAHDVEQLLPMADAIRSQEEAFRLISEKEVTSPVRHQIRVGEADGTALFMPALAGNYLGTKAVTVFPRNATLGRAVIQGVVLLFDKATGEPCAVIDGTYLTALRTGAASGVATQVLSHPSAKRAVVIGTGVQAETQCLAICAVRDLVEIGVYSRHPERVARFIEKMAPRIRARLYPAAELDRLIEEADIICTATSSQSPVFRGELVPPGCHINAIGAFTPSSRELDSDVISRARLFIDDTDSCLQEAGDVLIPLKEGRIRKECLIELGNVISGRSPGRRAKEDITVFKSVGVAVQDIVAAGWLYQKVISNPSRTGLYA